MQSSEAQATGDSSSPVFRESLLPARLSWKGAIMYSVDPAERGRGLVRQPFPGFV